MPSRVSPSGAAEAVCRRDRLDALELVLEGRFLVCSFGDKQYMPLADEREWRERLVAATARAIVQLRGHDDLTTWRLVADLDALRRRLLTQLEQEAANLLPSLAVTEPGRDSAA